MRRTMRSLRSRSSESTKCSAWMSQLSPKVCRTQFAYEVRPRMPPLTNATRGVIGSVRDGELAGHDRPRARQKAAPRQVADPEEDADEDRQLDRFGAARARHHLPHQPQDRLREAHRPHQAVKIPALVPLSLRGRFDAGQL